MIRRNPELKVLKAVMLFPTIERMAVTPQGRAVTPLICHLRYLAYVPVFLLSLLPEPLKQGLVRLALGGIRGLDPTILQPTVGLLSGDCAANAIYKDRYFTAETKEKVKKMLLEKLKNQLQCDSPDESVPVPEGERTVARGNNSLLDMYDEIIQENTEGAGRQEKMHVEVQFQTYISEATLPMKTQTLTPLDFWAKNKSRFPDLAQIARKYLSAPCTSVDSERLFSAAANVMDEKRNRLGCEKAEMIPLIRPELA
uniref:HAT C-terminal dimerisation domain-containing protein n=1 Tax=Knipowitschia caucasica TaxID=637954 RepID=A0AAV2JHH6_KNICA